LKNIDRDKFMTDELEKKPWWNYIHQDLRGLLMESTLLVDKVGAWEEKFDDYAFVVFPAAKAYEGFLKTLFLDLGFISEKRFYGKRFRVGKALNPSLNRRLMKKVGVYDKLVDFCGADDLPKKMWNTWKTCRNLLFHWFPNEKNVIDFNEAKQRVEKVIDTIDLAYKGCKIER
jgi:hypothetical protein